MAKRKRVNPTLGSAMPEPDGAALRGAWEAAGVAADVRAHRVLSTTRAELYGIPTWKRSKLR